MSVAGQAGGLRRPSTGLTLPQFSLLPLVASVSTVVSVALCAGVAVVLILNARMAVEREMRSAFDLARHAIVLRLPPAFGGTDTLGAAIRLAEEVDAQRHVSVAVLDLNGDPMRTRGNTTAGVTEAPAWFAGLLTPEEIREVYSVTSYPNVLGTLNLLSDPSDEIDEVWEDFRLILPMLCLMGFGMVLLSMLLTQFVVRRLRHIKHALAEMQGGDLDARAPTDGIRELANLSEGVNALARHLGHERHENTLLHARLLSLSETERARIASDLHDEMGPQLFALGAAADQASFEVARGTAMNIETLGETLTAVCRHTQAVQRSARDAINDLRPMLAGDATLGELLEDLAAEFSTVTESATVEVSADLETSVDAVSEIALYRFARESVLNAMRHGRAERIVITVAAEGGDVVIRVADNGCGVQDAHTSPGLGQIGMADRARAIGAGYRPPWRADGWTMTEMKTHSG